MVCIERLRLSPPVYPNQAGERVDVRGHDICTLRPQKIKSGGERYNAQDLCYENVVVAPHAAA